MKIPGWLVTTLGWTVMPGLPTGGDLTIGPGETLSRQDNWDSPLSTEKATAALSTLLTELGGDVTQKGPATTASLGSSAHARLLRPGSGGKRFVVAVSLVVEPARQGSTVAAEVTSAPRRGDLFALDDVRNDLLFQRSQSILDDLRQTTAADRSTPPS